MAFLAGLGAMFGGKTGLALAAAPIAFQALSDLNRNSASGGENLAGAAGSLGGGVPLALLGAGLAPRGWRPAGALLGGWLGSQGGSGLGRNVFNTFAAVSPEERQMDLMRQMARADVAAFQTRLPIFETRQRWAQEAQERDMALRLRANGLAAYQQGLMGAALGPSPSFTDGGMSGLIANLGSSFLS